MTPEKSNASIGGGIERYRGLTIRLAAIIAIIVLVVIGVRYLLGGGPEEKFRVAHAAGYSVIRPSDWKATLINTPDSDGFRDSIMISPDHWIGLEPLLWVKRYGSPPDLQKLQSIGFTSGTFQGQPAWISHQQLKRDLVQTVVFQRDDDWFNAGARLPGLEGAKLGDWWRYIQSFQPGINRTATTSVSQ